MFILKFVYTVILSKYWFLNVFFGKYFEIFFYKVWIVIGNSNCMIVIFVILKKKKFVDLKLSRLDCYRYFRL